MALYKIANSPFSLVAYCPATTAPHHRRRLNGGGRFSDGNGPSFSSFREIRQQQRIGWMDGIGNRWENNRDPNNAKIFTDSRTTLCGNHKRRSVLRPMGRGGGWSPVVSRRAAAFSEWWRKNENKTFWRGVILCSVGKKWGQTAKSLWSQTDRKKSLKV